MKTVSIQTPLNKQTMAVLCAGDRVLLSGEIFTARDAAHERMRLAVETGATLPIDLIGATIFYAGPCPTRPGRAIGSIAATTSARMDKYMAMMFAHGMASTIGKGERSQEVAELCRRYGGVYFLSVGGAAALISKCVKRCEVVAYEDLGTESIKRLEVVDLPLIVGIDAQGNAFGPGEIQKYRIS